MTHEEIKRLAEDDSVISGLVPIYNTSFLGIPRAPSTPATRSTRRFRDVTSM